MQSITSSVAAVRCNLSSMYSPTYLDGLLYTALNILFNHAVISGDRNTVISMEQFSCSQLTDFSLQ